LVVIEDDDIDAAGGEFTDGFGGGGTAVHGEDKAGGAMLEAVFDGIGAEAIAFVHAIGDEMGDLKAQSFEDFGEDGGGGDAIDVVIAEDDHRFTGGASGEETFHGRLHVGEEEGVGEFAEARGEEGLGGFRGKEVTVGEALGEECADAELAGEMGDQLGWMGSKEPAVFHGNHHWRWEGRDGSGSVGSSTSRLDGGAGGR
jgi:hypothetical protein